MDPKDGTPVGQSAPVELPKDVKWGEPVSLVKASPGSIPKGQGTKHTVSFVRDGDTFDTASGIACRVDTFDAPETAKPKLGKPGQPYGEESKKTLQDMILNKEVDIKIIRPADKYGRSICQVEINGKNIDKAMIEQGAAWVYDYFAKGSFQYSDLMSAQNAAKKAGKGLWKDPNPMYPPLFRQQNP